MSAARFQGSLGVNSNKLRRFRGHQIELVVSRPGHTFRSVV